MDAIMEAIPSATLPQTPQRSLNSARIEGLLIPSGGTRKGNTRGLQDAIHSAMEGSYRLDAADSITSAPQDVASVLKENAV
jgi:hypothetical protein